VFLRGYSKSDQEDLSADELKQLVKDVATLTEGE
jgi:hypothetical protein